MDSLKKIIDEMRESIAFNRTPYHLLPPEFRVHGCITGDAVVTRPAVADRLEGWANRLDKIRDSLKESLNRLEGGNGDDGKDNG